MVHIEHILKKEFLNLNKREMNNSIFKNGQKICTDTSLKKMCRWQISIWKDALRHVSLEKCRFEPRDATLPADGHSPEHWQQQMLAKKGEAAIPIHCWRGWKGPSHFGKQFSSLLPTQHTKPSHSLAFTQRTENSCAQKNLHRNAFVCLLVTRPCPTLRDPMDCSPPGTSAHGILQAGILEWVALP